MKRALRISVCLIVSFIVVLLSGYGNLMNDISESLAVTTFLGAMLVLSIFLVLLWELFLSFHVKINELAKRIEELEEKNNAE